MCGVGVDPVEQGLCLRQIVVLQLVIGCVCVFVRAYKNECMRVGKKKGGDRVGVR